MASELLNLLKQVKGPENKADIGRIQKQLMLFFMEEAKRGREDPDWGDKDVWHPSEISYGFCSRRKVYEKVAPDAVVDQEPHDPGLMRIFGFGHAIHRWYQEKVLGPMGILYGRWYCNVDIDTGKPIGPIREGLQPDRWWRYLEPSVWIGAKNIGGHTDGILKFGDEYWILEIKTANDASWRFMKEPRDYHKRQARLYLRGEYNLAGEWDEAKRIIPTKILFLYVNKNTSIEKLFVIEQDADDLQGMYDSIDGVETALRTHNLPERLSTCKTRRSADAKRCPACGVCFSGRSFDDLKDGGPR